MRLTRDPSATGAGDPLEARVRQRLGRRLTAGSDRPLAVALSGGGDSVALLHMTARWAMAARRPLVAITVDHRLNPKSAGWTRRCAAHAAHVGAAFVECAWTADKPATGLPAAARRARHAMIAQAARKAGARVVLFAHTADDQIENALMRRQGISIGQMRDWTASPVWPEGRELMLFRPLLDVSRADLRAWLRTSGLDWIDDPANSDLGSARTRARAELAEPEANGPTAPLSSASIDNDGWRALPLGAGFVLDRDAPARVVAAALVSSAGRERPLSGARLHALMQRFGAGETFTATLGGARIEATEVAVQVCREPGEFRRRPRAADPLPAGDEVVWDGRYLLRARSAGWSAAPAAGRLAVLSTQDRRLLADLPASARGGLPVLFREGGGAPVLAWRAAEVRALAPRRLTLALAGLGGETTQEADLERPIHGETPPTDLF